jgi:hypothetical protein
MRNNHPNWLIAKYGLLFDEMGFGVGIPIFEASSSMKGK